MKRALTICAAATLSFGFGRRGSWLDERTQARRRYLDDEANDELVT